jgi:glycine/D-amino acid oxidase-like deaminating enzyme
MAGGDDPYLAATEATLKRTGVSFDRLSRDELAKRWPQFCFDGIEWSLFEPDSGILMARRAVMAVAKDAIAHGVEYRFGAVLPLSSAAGRKRLASISMASGESVTAETFIFCCGPWLPKVFPDLLAERMFISRQEVFFFGTAPGETAFRQPQCPTWLEMSAGIYGMPNIGGRGFKVAIDTHGPRFDPETGDRTPTAEGLAMARLYVARRFPALASAPLLEARVCQYENTSNGDFLIDRHPEYENVWMVGGGSGHGFKHGPAVGEYVAGVIAGRRTPEPRFRLAAKASHQNRAVF